MCSADVEACKPISQIKNIFTYRELPCHPHNPISVKVNLIIYRIKINNTILWRLYMYIQNKMNPISYEAARESTERYLYKYKTVLKFITSVTVSLFCRCNLSLHWVLTTHATFYIYVFCFEIRQDLGQICV